MKISSVITQVVWGLGLLLSLTWWGRVSAQTAPPADLTGANLRTWLKTNWYDGRCNVLSYNSARARMYSTIDARSGFVYCVYTGFKESNAQTLAIINCEHTIPQSFFNSNSPMVSDIHHLFPTHNVANSTRNNFPYGFVSTGQTTSWLSSTNSGSTFVQQTTQPSGIPLTQISRFGSSRFYPRADHRGNAARAIFYFFTMYDLTSFGRSMASVGNIDSLYKWHLEDPVDDAERARNTATQSAQGNRNPYIDYPDLVGRAWGFSTQNCVFPTVQASGLSFTTTGPTTATVNFTGGNGTARLVVVRQGSDISSPSIANNTAYTASTVFGQGSQVGTGNFVVASGSATSVNITGLTSGTTYFVRVYEYNCSGNTSQYLLTQSGGAVSTTTTACPTPTTQTNAIVRTGATSASLTLNWTNGNGAGRLLVGRVGTAVTALPSNGTSYAGDAVFGSGQAVSTGQFALYSGTASTITISGLTPNTTYHFAAFEYSCSGIAINYQPALGSNNQFSTTTPQSSGGVSDLIISEYIEGSSNNKYVEIYNGTGTSVNLSDYQLRLFANGSTTPNNSNTLSGTLASGSVVVYRNSSATIYAGASTALSSMAFNGNDALGLWKISTASYVDMFGIIGNDPGTAWTGAGGYSTLDRTLRRKANICQGISTIPSGTVFATLTTEWDLANIDDVSGLGNHVTSCAAATCTAPTQQASNLLSSAITSTSATLSWTRGNGNAGVVVLLEPGLTLDTLPVSGTLYSANADWLSSASSQLGVAKVVALGSGSSVSVTNLSPATAYSYSAFEYNTLNTCYNRLATSQIFYTLALAPSAYPASFSAVSNNLGNGATLSFDPVSSLANVKGYLIIQNLGTSISSFVPSDGISYQVGDAAGTGLVVGVVTSSSQGSFVVSNLSAGNNYSFSLFPFNSDVGMTASTYKYKSDGAIPSTTAPIGVLSLSHTVSGVVCSNIGGVSASIPITVTNSFSISAGNVYTVELSDNSGAFLAPTVLATITSQSGALNQNITVPTGTTSGVGYRLRVKSSNPASTSSASLPLEIVNSPQAVSGLQATPTSTQANLSWNLPTSCLSGVLVVVKQGSSVSGAPNGDGSLYNADANFGGAGTSFGGGKVVAKGMVSSVTVTGLTQGQSFWAKAFVWNGTAWESGIEISFSQPSATPPGGSGDVIFTQIEHELMGSDLFISEYVEGSSNNKYLEIYNPTNSGISLSNFLTRTHSNGATSTTDRTGGFTGTLAANKCLVLRNSSAALSLTGYADLVVSNTGMDFNGNDAVELRKSGATHEVFGNIGCDPGTAWTNDGLTTLDRTLRRTPTNLTRVSTDPVNVPCSFPTLLQTNWTQFSQDEVGGLGFHSAEVARRTLVEFLTLRTMNLNGLALTDRGVCSSGRFLDIAGDRVFTFPNTGLENVPQGTLVRVLWTTTTGSHDLDASDGVISLIGNIDESAKYNYSTGDQLILYSGTANAVTACTTGTATDTKISGIHFGPNVWRSGAQTVTNQDESFAPGTATDFQLNGLANHTDFRYSGSISGDVATITATSSGGIRNASNWTNGNSGNNQGTVKDVKFVTPTYLTGAVNISNRTKTTAQVSWAGVSFSNSSSSTRYLLVVRQGTTLPDAPADRYTAYGSVSGNFASAPTVISSISGTPINLPTEVTATAGNGKVVFLGAATSVSLSGLTEKTTYSYRVFALNGNGYTAAFSPVSASLAGQFTTATAEIALIYNGQALANGGLINPPALLSGTSQDAFITLTNTGEAALEITGATITGDYSLPSSAVQTILPGASRNLVVRFSPMAKGDRTGVLTLATSDLTDLSFVVNLSATGLGSAQSDIVSGDATGYVTEVSYGDFLSTTITTSAQGVNLLNWQIREGGATGDADNLPTVVDSLVFILSDPDMVKAAAVFDGNTLVNNGFSKVGNRLIFASLNLSVADNTSKQLSLRVSFEAAQVIDNTNLSAQLVRIVGTNSGSQFLTPVQSIGIHQLGRNKLVVVASVLTVSNLTLVPGACQVGIQGNVSARDALGNLDVDFAGPISISTSIATNTTNAATVTPSFSQGLAVINGLFAYRNFSTATFGLAAAGLQGSFSTSVSQINCATVLYRKTTQDGAWDAGIWESWLANGATNASSEGGYGMPPNADTLSVRIAHQVSVNQPVVLGSCRIESGKSLTVNAAVRFAGDIWLEPNAKLEITSAIRRNANSSLRLEAGSQLIINPSAAIQRLDTSIWRGLELIDDNASVVVNAATAQTLLTQGLSVQSGGNYFGRLVVKGSFSDLQVGDSNALIAKSLIVDTDGDTVFLSRNSCKGVIDSLQVVKGHLALAGAMKGQVGRLIIGQSGQVAQWSHLAAGNPTSNAITRATHYYAGSQAKRLISGWLYVGGESGAAGTFYEAATTQAADGDAGDVRFRNVALLSDILRLTGDSIKVDDNAEVDLASYAIKGGAILYAQQARFSTSHAQGLGNNVNSGAFQGLNLQIGSKNAFKYYGSLSQITGTALPQVISALEVLKSGALLRLSRPITIESELSLSAGKLFTAGCSLTLGTSSAPADFLQGTDTANTYLALRPLDKLIWNMGGRSNQTMIWPIGDSLSYSPFRLTMRGATINTNARLEVRVVDSVMPYLASGQSGVANYLTRYWQVEPKEMGGVNYDVSLSFPMTDLLQPSGGLKLIKWNQSLGLTSGPIVSLPTGADFGSLSWSGLTSFSDFSGGEGGPLPVMLSYFKAQQTANTNRLLWGTSTEINNKGFEIERQEPSGQWRVLGFVSGAGSTNEKRRYQFEDHQPEPRCLYRLKQIDYDGKYEYSPVLAVNRSQSNMRFPYLLANPSQSLQLEIPHLVTPQLVTVTNAIGQIVARQLISQSLDLTSLAGQSSAWPKGMYLVTIVSEDGNYSLRYVKP